MGSFVLGLLFWKSVLFLKLNLESCRERETLQLGKNTYGNRSYSFWVKFDLSEIIPFWCAKDEIQKWTLNPGEKPRFVSCVSILCLGEIWLKRVFICGFVAFLTHVMHSVFLVVCFVASNGRFRDDPLLPEFVPHCVSAMKYLYGIIKT